MNRKKYLLTNTAAFAIGNLGTKFISFFMVPLYTYVLTTQEYGITDIIFTISMLLTPVVMMNIGEAVMRYSLDEDANHTDILDVALVVFFIGSIGSLAIIPILSLIPSLKQYSLLTYFLILTSAVFYIPLGFLRGTEQIKLYNFCNLLLTFLTALLNLLFLLVFKWGIRGYLLSSVWAYAVVTVFAFFTGRVYRYLKNFHFDRGLAKQMFAYSIALVPNSLLWWITNSSDRFFVTAFLGAAANGIYAVAYKFPSLLTTVSTIFTQAWQLSAIKEDRAEDREQFHQKIYDAFFEFTFLVGSAFLLILKPAMKIYVSPAFYEAWRYVPFLLLAYMLGAIGTFVGISYTVAKNNVGHMLSALVGACVNIVLNLILIPKIGVNGASIATCVSYFAVFLFRVFNTQKYVRLRAFSKIHVLIFLLFFLQMSAVYLNPAWGWPLGFFSLCAIAFFSRKTIRYFWNELKFLIRKKIFHEKNNPV